MGLGLSVGEEEGMVDGKDVSEGTELGYSVFDGAVDGSKLGNTEMLGLELGEELGRVDGSSLCIAVGETDGTTLG